MVVMVDDSSVGVKLVNYVVVWSQWWSSISEGWVRVQAGKTVDRKGQPLTIKLTGPVEAWYEDLGDNPPVAKKD